MLDANTKIKILRSNLCGSQLKAGQILNVRKVTNGLIHFTDTHYMIKLESLGTDFEIATITTKTQDNSATKHDQSKVPLELLSPIALHKIAEVMAFGAKKYDAHNWRKGMKWSRLVGASLRHILAWASGEDKDPESGISHLCHAACCIMFLIEYEELKIGDDDRYKHDR